MQYADDSTIGSGPSARWSPSAPAARRLALPTLTILAHPDPGRVGDRATLGELVTGARARVDRYRPELHAPGHVQGRPLGVRHVSRKPITLARTAAGDLRLDVTKSPTSVHVDGQLVSTHRDLTDREVAAGVVIELARRIVLLLHLHTPRAQHEPDTMGLVGQSDGMTMLREDIRRVADLDVGVLIRGETGTGKELVAQALHQLGPRPAGPFVAVNLGAVPPSLAASELFGAARGAFTGAAQARDGCFVRADRGTLFLDEVGETPPEIQVALLRTLESGEVTPIGAAAARRVQTRTLAATDADLDAKIASGDFRAPLLHRLAGYEIQLPPLRERRDDLGILLLHFLRAEATRLGDDRLDQASDEPWIDSNLMARLARFAWPGNVRQLRNVARQLAIGNRGQHCLRTTSSIERMLDQPAVAPSTSPATSAQPAIDRRLPSKTEDAEILSTLRSHRFEIKKAAKALGISRAALYAWINDSPVVHTAGQLDADTIRRAHRELDGNLDEIAAQLEVSRFALQRRVRELKL